MNLMKTIIMIVFLFTPLSEMGPVGIDRMWYIFESTRVQTEIDSA